jgi:hypothetical protein
MDLTPRNALGHKRFSDFGNNRFNEHLIANARIMRGRPA